MSAKLGQLGIIPGSLGARSHIVRGKGNPESFESCSHGAGRVMSRGEAKRRFTLADHRAATEGVECRKDKVVLDETPAAYKDIDAVMEAQRDLVEVVHILKQVVCVKGWFHANSRGVRHKTDAPFFGRCSAPAPLHRVSAGSSA